MIWTISNRGDPRAVKIADRHYNRQKIGSPQFVPPGRCLVFRVSESALWVTSWPLAEYVKHAWAGAWVNSLFRNEKREIRSSDMITQAVAATRSIWAPPPSGIVTFVDPKCVPGVVVRGKRIFGYCYQKAGWHHVGFTKSGLWAWQQLPDEMPDPALPLVKQLRFDLEPPATIAATSADIQVRRAVQCVASGSGADCK